MLVVGDVNTIFSLLEKLMLFWACIGEANIDFSLLKKLTLTQFPWLRLKVTIMGIHPFLHQHQHDNASDLSKLKLNACLQLSMVAS